MPPRDLLAYVYALRLSWPGKEMLLQFAGSFVSGEF